MIKKVIILNLSDKTIVILLINLVNLGENKGLCFLKIMKVRFICLYVLKNNFNYCKENEDIAVNDVKELLVT